MTDADYIHAFQKIVMPIATQFAPDLVMSELDWKLLSLASD
jgi:acetoin utilization deacetylase AcuC-like enzyme